MATGDEDVIGGVVGGASAGSSFGPYGAIIGGVLGGIGGLATRDKKREARRYVRMANKLREQTYRLRSFAEQRNLLRQGQIQAAATLAAAPAAGVSTQSSAFQGVNASIWVQMLDNYALGETILNRQLSANRFEERAGLAGAQAQTIGDIMGAAQSITRAIPRSVPEDKPQFTYTGNLPQPRQPPGLTTYPVGGPGEVAGSPLLSSRGN